MTDTSRKTEAPSTEGLSTEGAGNGTPASVRAHRLTGANRLSVGRIARVNHAGEYGWGDSTRMRRDLAGLS